MKGYIRLILLTTPILYILLACNKNKPEVPQLTTKEVDDIIGNSALSGGNITSDGGATVTVRGVCWSFESLPTIDDSKTTDGAGAGSFSSSLTGLKGGTYYFVRAYAINKIGTGYGNEDYFRTPLNNIDFNSSITYSSIIDQDGNTYKTVKIGTQNWMAENMRAIHYYDGSPIPNVNDCTSWTQLTTGAYCWFNNDTYYKDVYGALYNWYAVSDSRKLCPVGWHVPTDAEWTTMENFLGGEIAGDKMKEVGISHWPSPTFATNESGLTALPSGSRECFYKYDFMGGGWWWSSTDTSSYAWYRSMVLERNIFRYWKFKTYGFSVRCLMD